MIDSLPNVVAIGQHCQPYGKLISSTAQLMNKAALGVETSMTKDFLPIDYLPSFALRFAPAATATASDKT